MSVAADDHLPPPPPPPAPRSPPAAAVASVKGQEPPHPLLPFIPDGEALPQRQPHLEQMSERRGWESSDLHQGAGRASPPPPAPSPSGAGRERPPRLTAEPGWEHGDIPRPLLPLILCNPWLRLEQTEGQWDKVGQLRGSVSIPSEGPPQGTSALSCSQQSDRVTRKDCHSSGEHLADRPEVATLLPIPQGGDRGLGGAVSAPAVAVRGLSCVICTLF